MQHIIFIMGVSGAGKTTIGKLLAAQTGIPFFDADDFHCAANKEKMKAGIALNDEDRKDWLLQLNELAVIQSKAIGAIIACSALKEKYREVLSKNLHNPQWIFLEGSYEEIHQRLLKRQTHFMPAALLASQFEALEIPGNAIMIGVQKNPLERVNIILNHLQQRLSG